MQSPVELLLLIISVGKTGIVFSYLPGDQNTNIQHMSSNSHPYFLCMHACVYVCVFLYQNFGWIQQVTKQKDKNEKKDENEENKRNYSGSRRLKYFGKVH